MHCSGQIFLHGILKRWPHLYEVRADSLEAVREPVTWEQVKRQLIVA